MAEGARKMRVALFVLVFLASIASAQQKATGAIETGICARILVAALYNLAERAGVEMDKSVVRVRCILFAPCHRR